MFSSEKMFPSHSSVPSTGPFFSPVPDIQLQEGDLLKDKNPCAGWESDPQDIGLAAAGHWLKTRKGKKDVPIKKINISESGISVRIEYEGMTVTVLRIIDKAPKGSPIVWKKELYVGTSFEKGKGDFCKYSYDCNEQGRIAFTEMACS